MEEAPAQPLCPNSPWTRARSWSALCAELKLKLRHSTRTILSKTPLENTLKQLKSWERHGLGEEGKTESDRQADIFSLSFSGFWLTQLCCLPFCSFYSIQPSPTTAHQMLTPISSSRVMKASGACTLADYAYRTLWQRRSFLACQAVKVVLRTWGHIIMLFITSH